MRAPDPTCASCSPPAGLRTAQAGRHEAHPASPPLPGSSPAAQRAASGTRLWSWSSRSPSRLCLQPDDDSRALRAAAAPHRACAPLLTPPRPPLCAAPAHCPPPQRPRPAPQRMRGRPSLSPLPPLRMRLPLPLLCRLPAVNGPRRPPTAASPQPLSRRHGPAAPPHVHTAPPPSPAPPRPLTMAEQQRGCCRRRRRRKRTRSPARSTDRP